MIFFSGYTIRYQNGNDIKFVLTILIKLCGFICFTSVIILSMRHGDSLICHSKDAPGMTKKNILNLLIKFSEKVGNAYCSSNLFIEERVGGHTKKRHLQIYFFMPLILLAQVKYWIWHVLHCFFFIFFWVILMNHFLI